MENYLHENIPEKVKKGLKEYGNEICKIIRKYCSSYRKNR